MALAAAAPGRIALAHRPAGIYSWPVRLTIGVLLGRRLAQLIEQQQVSIDLLRHALSGGAGSRGWVAHTRPSRRINRRYATHCSGVSTTRQHRRGRLNVGDVLVLETLWAQQYDQDGNPKGPKIEDQASVDAVPRNVTIGFYGPLSIREGTDPAWIEAAEQAYRSDGAAARQQQAIPLADAEDYGDEFADAEVPF
jgi:hypothetical protein